MVSYACAFSQSESGEYFGGKISICTHSVHVNVPIKRKEKTGELTI